MPMTGRCREPNCHAMVVRPLHYCEQHAHQEESYRQSRQRWANNNDTERYKRYNRERKDNPERDARNKFYQSTVWKHIRLRVLDRDNHLCQYCLSRGRVRQGNVVDHIVPYEFDQSQKMNIDNLATCCKYCHVKKSEFERNYYGTGVGNILKKVIVITNVADVPDFKTP